MTTISTQINKSLDLKQPKALGRPKSSQKREQILHHATELFLLHGYDRTSMDAVARHSGVSKQTVYSHFKNKDILYCAVIETKCAEYQIEESTINVLNKPLSESLYAIASNFIHLLNDKRVIAMYSVVISESKNNQHVAELFYNSGPLHSMNLVIDLLIKHPSSQLSAQHAHEAASDFFNLLKGDYHMRSLLGLPFERTEDQLNEFAHKVVAKTLQIMQLYL